MSSLQSNANVSGCLREAQKREVLKILLLKTNNFLLKQFPASGIGENKTVKHSSTMPASSYDEGVMRVLSPSKNKSHYSRREVFTVMSPILFVFIDNRAAERLVVDLIASE